MKKAVTILTLLFVLGACGMFGGGGDGDVGTNPPPVDKCNQAKVCVQITEANKSQITEEFGRSCKVGDWLGKGDAYCSSTEAKCKCK